MSSIAPCFHLRTYLFAVKGFVSREPGVVIKRSRSPGGVSAYEAIPDSISF